MITLVGGLRKLLNKKSYIKMKKRHILLLTGFLLFLLGFVAIVVELIGLPFALTDWIYLLLGTTSGFFFKLLLVIAGIVLTVLSYSGNDEEKYDEYFDGDSYN